MSPRLYSELASWYRLIDPPIEHEEDAETFLGAFRANVAAPLATLLELGAGGGHNALFLKRSFQCTLVDVADEMLALSRELNPECEHVRGDMRTLRLGRTFDTVLIHDAIVYMTTKDELRAAIETAALHTRPGGAVLLAPDHLRDTWLENADSESASDATRTVHNFMWDWDPDPNDDAIVTEFVLMLRENGEVRVVHDRHVSGVFHEATWRELMEGAGLEVVRIERPVEAPYADHIFLGKKRGA